MKSIQFALVCLLALPLVALAQSDILIRNVNVIPMSSPDPEVLANQSVLITNGVIQTISPEITPPNSSTLIIDGTNKYLMPGLVDAHAHVWSEAELAAFLSFGITTVRNVSGMPFHLQFQQKIKAGELIGPTILTTGPILNGQGPNTQINHQIVNNAEQARAAVNQQYSQGYRHLKVYSNLSRESYEAINSEAAKLNMSIMGHTPEGVRENGIPQDKPFKINFNEILDDNFISIEHMESIVWHGLADDLNEHKIRALAKAIAVSGTAVTPTLIAHYNLTAVAKSQGEYLRRDEVDLINPFIKKMEQDSYEYWSSQDKNARQKYNHFYSLATLIFQEEGVTLLAGTDAGIFTNIPGRSLYKELNLFVQAGLTPYQALQTATINPNKAFGHNNIGKIAPGYTADLVLLSKDPTINIQNLDSLTGVVLKGKWVGNKDIEKLKVKARSASASETEKRVYDGLNAQTVTH